MCHSFFNEARRLYRIGDTLSGSGARSKVGSVRLTEKNFRNFRFNEQGTLVCGTGRRGIILWNEGKWATLTNRSVSPSSCLPEVDRTQYSDRANAIGCARTCIRPGTVFSGSGFRRSMGSCSISQSDLNQLRFNEHGNLLAGTKLIWHRHEGFACVEGSSPCGGGNDVNVHITVLNPPPPSVEQGPCCPTVQPIRGAKVVKRVTL